MLPLPLSKISRFRANSTIGPSHNMGPDPSWLRQCGLAPSMRIFAIVLTVGLSHRLRVLRRNARHLNWKWQSRWIHRIDRPNQRKKISFSWRPKVAVMETILVASDRIFFLTNGPITPPPIPKRRKRHCKGAFSGLEKISKISNPKVQKMSYNKKIIYNMGRHLAWEDV